MNKMNFELFSDVLDKRSQEMMSSICNNLSFINGDLKTIAVTSCSSGEGASYITLQLARALTRSNKRVVVLDSDFHHSVYDKGYDTELKGDSKTLIDYLTGKYSITDVLYATNVHNLFFIPCPELSTNPSYLFDLPHYSELIKTLSNVFDMILIDTPAAGTSVDAAKISKFCDGIVLVVAYGKTRRNELNEMLYQFKKTGCPILGCIINKVNFRSIISRKAYPLIRKAR